MRRWAFVRHGQSIANAEGWLAGQIDSPLSARGRAEAEALQGKLHGYQRVLCSDLQRARQTAELARFGLPVEVYPELRERTIGDWDGASREQLGDDFQRILTWSGRPPGGESQEDLAARVLRCLAGHDGPLDTIVVCHGGVIRVLLGLLDGLPHEQVAFRRIPNADPIEVELEPGRFRELLNHL